MAKKKGKPSRRQITFQDLKKAEMDPILKYKVRQRSTVPAIITGQDRIVIRKFARKTLPVAKQRNAELTHPQLMKNIIAVLKKVKPDMRKTMLEKMYAYVDEH